MTSRDRALTLVATSASAAAAFALLAAAVARRETSHIDRALRPKIKLRKGHPVREAADKMAPLGKWWIYVPVSAGIATYLMRTSSLRALPHRRAGAAAIVTSATLAFGLAQIFDRTLPQPPAPPGHRARTKPVFPSGHAFGPGTVSMTTAYVLAREEVVSPAAAAAIAFGVPIISAGGKLIEEKHWGSDVLGGLLAATMLSAACLSVYEAGR